MKITQVMLAKGFGGAERHFVDLSLSLAEKGYRIQAICHQAFSHQSALRAHPNIAVTRFNVLAAWDPLARYRIRQAIAGFGPDVIHAHLARGALMGGAAARALGIPAVVNLHNYIDLKYYANISAFIAATEDQKNYLLAHGINTQKITVMPHFSRLAATTPSPLPEDRPVRFIALGRMVKKKGFDVLIEAFREFLTSGHDGRLIIGGDGPERIRLQALAAHPALAKKIEFAGWVDDIAGFLSRGDVFVLPSLDEPFGIVVLEAMASGRPIITTRTQGPITILNDRTACFADIGDAAAITQAMQTMVQDKPGTMRRAEAASLLYQSTYCADAVVPQVEAIYRQLAG
ncbi:alpha-D-kanosaminyltransferase [mine drainage metagenome]|uniref:Alpha-D-kanosaminyltransferase n=1 Tax=mine drainage metagenome TaxID=410659 RepID=A0A1J5QC96_9ZZZZ